MLCYAERSVSPPQRQLSLQNLTTVYPKKQQLSDAKLNGDYSNTVWKTKLWLETMKVGWLTSKLDVWIQKYIASPWLKGFCYCYCLHECKLKFPNADGQLKDKAFLVSSVKSSLAHGLGASTLTLAGTSASSAASELNYSGPLSRLARFDMLWAGHFSSSSEQGKEEPEDYKLFGSVAVRHPYSSCTLVPRLTMFSFPFAKIHCWWAAFQPGLSASSDPRALHTGWAYSGVGIKRESLPKLIMRC